MRITKAVVTNLIVVLNQSLPVEFSFHRPRVIVLVVAHIKGRESRLQINSRKLFLP